MTNTTSFTDSYGIVFIIFECWAEIDADDLIKDKDIGKDKVLDYALAISLALEQSEYSSLITLLRGVEGYGISPPLRMLPAIAEVLDRIKKGFKVGVQPKHTQIEKYMIYRHVSKLYCNEDLTLENACYQTAQMYNISFEQVKKIRLQCLRHPKLPKYKKGINHP
jgi:hypothetical protein